MKKDLYHEHLWKIAVELAVKQASSDVSSLVELHEQDPKMANEVAKKFGYSSYKEAMESVKKGQIAVDQKKVKVKLEPFSFKELILDDGYDLIYFTKKRVAGCIRKQNIVDTPAPVYNPDVIILVGLLVLFVVGVIFVILLFSS